MEGESKGWMASVDRTRQHVDGETSDDEWMAEIGSEQEEQRSGSSSDTLA